AAPWQAVEAGPLELAQDLLGGHPGEPRHAADLLRAGDLQPYARVTLFEEAQKARVPVEGQVGVHTARHQHARAPDGLQLRQLRADLLVGEYVRVILPTRAVEAAEAAAHVADVRVVDVAIDQVRDGLGVRPGQANLVGGGGHVEERQVVKGEGLRRGEPAPGGRIGQEAHVCEHITGPCGVPATIVYLVAERSKLPA